ncbi:MAG: Holliday junction branch migration protein RuvA [Chitinivibrionales bacterium]|nr:Holliday junction branch migration protein RuvA [Chitinivibrionales bacterium]MBD3356032.1 Holliday junction branch migration protein RuvA [Chitinivibrionales bacterium]
MRLPPHYAVTTIKGCRASRWGDEIRKSERREREDAEAVFEYVKGILADKGPAYAVVDVGGVGYLMDIPVSTFDRLPESGGEIKLLVHYYVREDVQRLYGFSSKAERQAFRLLLGINQIGPKVALAVLSSISVDDLAQAVEAQDASRFKSVSGIGPKTAQRVVIELKGKLSAERGAAGMQSGTVGGSDRGNRSAVEKDAHEAMVSLGYSESQVARAIGRVREVLEPGAPVEEWIRKALQVI